MKKQNNLCAYLHADGKKIVDGSGKEILLSGWGLGNWLLQEDMHRSEEHTSELQSR